jgi:putative copper resistance protein D
LSEAAFAALAGARWIHFGSVMLLFGASLFPFYAAPAMSSWPPCAGARSAFRAAALIAFLSGIAWAATSLVNITGDVGSLFDRDAVSGFLFDTGFGKVWALRLFLLLALLAVALVAGGHLAVRNFATALLALLSGFLLVSQAWLGHAAATLGVERLVVMAGYALHVLGAGAWLGGLVPLWVMLRGPSADGARDGSVAFALYRFSTLGMFAIAMILAGGLINAWARWSSSDALLASAWGRVLIFKVLGFLVLVVLAAVNRFILMPRLAANTSVRLRLTRNVVVEQGAGLIILAAAAILGILPPPG